MRKLSALLPLAVFGALAALAIAYVLRAGREVRIAVGEFSSTREDLYADLDRLMASTEALLFSFVPHDSLVVSEREAVTAARNELFGAIIFGRSEGAVAAAFVELELTLWTLFERLEGHPITFEPSFVEARRKVEEAVRSVQIGAAARDMIVEDVRISTRRIPGPISRRLATIADGPHDAEEWSLGES